MKMDRINFIKTELNKHHSEALTLGHNVWVTAIQGSQNYNLDIYTEDYRSDIDTKCIIIPSLDQIIRNKEPVSHTHIRSNDEHIDLKDIRLMFSCFKKQNVNFVEVLFSDFYEVVDDKFLKSKWEDMKAIAEEIVHAHPAQTVKTMSGLSMEKFKALKHPYPTIKWKIDKWGYDGKQLHHIIRINDFLKRYMDGESFKSCLTPSPTIFEMLMKAKINDNGIIKAKIVSGDYDEFCDDF